MNLRKFKKAVLTKSRVFDQVSNEFQFLNALFIVVEKNYEMFDSMLHHVGGLRSSDSLLCQSDGKIPFPKKEIMDQLQDKKNLFENRLIDILISLKPAYEYNRQLVAVLDSIDDNMKIERQQFMEMNKEAVVVNQFYQHFNEVFKNFPMKIYRKHVRDIRRIVTDSENTDDDRTATKKLSEEMTELDQIYPEITEAFNLSLDIDFTVLQRATKRFSELVKKSFGSKSAPTIEDTMRSLKMYEASLKENKASNLDNSSNPLKAKIEMAVKRTQMGSSVDQAMNSLRAYEAKLQSESSNGSRDSSSSSSSASLGNEKENKGKEKKAKSFFGSKLMKKLTK